MRAPCVLLSPTPVSPTVAQAVAEATASGFAAASNGCGDDSIAEGTASATKTAIASAIASASADACSTGGVAEAVAESITTSIARWVQPAHGVGLSFGSHTSRHRVTCILQATTVECVLPSQPGQATPHCADLPSNPPRAAEAQGLQPAEQQHTLRSDGDVCFCATALQCHRHCLC